MFVHVTNFVETPQVNTFEEYLKSQDVVVVKYEAKWCSVCKDIEPTLDQLSDSHPDIPMVAVDIDEQPDIKHWARIKALPMIIMYKNGRQREFVFGEAPLEKYEQKLQRTMR